MSVTFQKYHLEHHCYQGVDGVRHRHAKPHRSQRCTEHSLKINMGCFATVFSRTSTPLSLKPKPPGVGEFINLTIQLALDAAIIRFGYLILSMFIGGWMVTSYRKHYVFSPDQETYSYYGPLNLMTWTVGYHNEQHDFPSIPGSKLHMVREMALEFYKNLDSYRSRSQVIYVYTVGPFCGMKSNQSTKSE